MNLAQRDKAFLDLKYRIQCKQNTLIERFDDVKQASAENKLLDGVLQDYIKYYKEALAAKRQQEESLTLLRDYLEAMGDAASVSDAQLEYLKEERSQTIERLNEIRRDMSRLLERTSGL